jgi:hypothetical protein
MNAVTVALISAACIFAGSIFGVGLQYLLPGHHLTKDMQDLVKLSAGTVATLTALVLGLLVSSSKGSFDAINAGIVQSSAKYILLDQVLARYGPEADIARAQLKTSLEAGIKTVWPEEKTDMPALTAFEKANGVQLFQDKLSDLKPQTDAQHQWLAQAQQFVNDLAQTRWLLIEQEHSELPLPLLLILVFWLVLLFVSFGLFAPRNATALTVLLIGACAISAAIFLVLELDQPLDGLIKVSNAPLLDALQRLGH